MPSAAGFCSSALPRGIQSPCFCEHRVEIVDAPEVVAELRLSDLHDERRRIGRVVAVRLVLRGAGRRLQHPRAVFRSGSLDLRHGVLLGETSRRRRRPSDPKGCAARANQPRVRSSARSAARHRVAHCRRVQASARGRSRRPASPVGGRDRPVHRALPQGADGRPRRGADPRRSRRRTTTASRSTRGARRSSPRSRRRESSRRSSNARSNRRWVKAALEDLYLPFKPKRRTRAAIARERGLEPLALRILAQPPPGAPERDAAPFVDPAKEVPDAKAALAGARDIVAERIAERRDVRAYVRGVFENEGVLVVRRHQGEGQGADEVRDVLRLSRAHAPPPVPSLPRHSSRRGRGGAARVDRHRRRRSGEPDRRAWRASGAGRRSPASSRPRSRDAVARLLAPSLENEIRERDEARGRPRRRRRLRREPARALARRRRSDAASSSGSTPASAPAASASSSTTPASSSSTLSSTWSRATAPSRPRRDTLRALLAPSRAVRHRRRQRDPRARDRRLLPRRRQGGGRLGARRPRERVGRERLLGERRRARGVPGSRPHRSRRGLDRAAAAGSAGGAREDRPEGHRRRAVPARRAASRSSRESSTRSSRAASTPSASSSIRRAPSSCRTSPASGASLAKKIVKHRDAEGAFRTRKDLLDVPGLGPKAFEQCAGFVRIRGGEHPLDASAVHPERYALVARDRGRREVEGRRPRSATPTPSRRCRGRSTSRPTSACRRSRTSSASS